jgi:hypothetical protein
MLFSWQTAVIQVLSLGLIILAVYLVFSVLKSLKKK